MKTILITGGSDGLGKALAEKLAKDYRVVILARNEQALQEIATKTGCDYIVCDVRDAKQVESAFEEITAKHTSIDVLINSAGVIVNGDLIDTPDEVIENVITTNTLGTIYVAKAALRRMKEQRSGLIINVVSTAGLTAKANRSIYNASKMGDHWFHEGNPRRSGRIWCSCDRFLSRHYHNQSICESRPRDERLRTYY